MRRLLTLLLCIPPFGCETAPTPAPPPCCSADFTICPSPYVRADAAIFKSIRGVLGAEDQERLRMEIVRHLFDDRSCVCGTAPDLDF